MYEYIPLYTHRYLDVFVLVKVFVFVDVCCMNIHISLHKNQRFF